MNVQDLNNLSVQELRQVKRDLKATIAVLRKDKAEIDKSVKAYLKQVKTSHVRSSTLFAMGATNGRHR